MSKTMINTPTFTREEIDQIHAELYMVNASNKCANPGHIGWIRGYNNAQIDRMGKKQRRQKL